MKIDPDSRSLCAGAGPARSRMSRQVLTPLLIAAGAIGLPLAFSLSRCSPTEEILVDELPPLANAATEYPNNAFQQGRGYYHLPYHMWFPLPYNSYEAGRGWFRGGVWRSAAQPDDVELREQQRQAQAAGNSFATRGFRSGSSGGLSRFQSSTPTVPTAQRPGSAAAPRSAPVLHGGFGSSSHPAAS